MVDLKYKSKMFGVMTDQERFISACAMIVKINTTTGWPLPTEKTIFDILADQFSKKMGESYANVNADEIEYAFRNNTTVKDWGKAMNLALIDEVMLPYLEKRFELSKVEESKKIQLMLPESKEDTSDLAMEDWLADTSLQIQKGNYDVQFVPPTLYDWMDKKGRITKTKAEKLEYLSKATAHRVVVLSQNLAANPSNENKQALEIFCAMMNKGVFEGDEIERLKTLAKKMLLFDMLKAEPK